MPRPKLGPRVNGPYYDSPTGKFKLRCFSGDLDKGSDVYFATKEAAQQAKAVMEQELAMPQNRPLGEMLADYMADKELRGKAKSKTCAEQLRTLRVFFADCLEEGVSRMTPQRAAALYQSSVMQKKANGESRKAATHHFYLHLAYSFFSWVVRKGYADKNPFKDVEAVGRVSVGKPQLRLEEAKRFAATALRLFDENPDDVLALASVVPLFLGLRAGEVLLRRVRDVDAGGALLWIDGGKTRNARRHLKVEAPELQVRLARLAGGRSPDEYLFHHATTGQPWSRQALWSAVQRICRDAEVPKVCPHSFRGLWATLSVESGAASSAVAAALGHGSFEITAKHYAQPEAVANARSAQVMEMLRLGAATDPGVKPSAQQLAERLSPDALAELLEVISQAILIGKRKRTVAA